MARRRDAPAEAGCPCGSGGAFDECCARLIAGHAVAPGAEALMRSRYAAYVTGAADYLLATWHPRTRPARLAPPGDPPPRWLGLRVEALSQADADHASVRFEALYKLGGRAHRLRETSRFERLDGRWYYVDGDTAEA